jgi:16S rRNA (uracil1498-N3)-methyltransferase
MSKTIHRFFVPAKAIGETHAVLTDNETVHQISRVLRMHPGDPLILLDNQGHEFLSRINEISKREVKIKIEEKRDIATEPSIKIRLLQALPKRLPKFETILKHGTELGASEFYPLLTAHGELRELRKRERMELIIKEAAEQSERGACPILGPEIDLKNVLMHGWPQELEADATLIAHARDDSKALYELVPELKELKSLNVLIGPEGGFSDEEIDALKEMGAQPFNLGKRILRTETASLAILSVLLLGSGNFDH